MKLSRIPLALALFALASVTGCAAFSSNSSDPTTAAASEDPAQTMDVDDEVPNVSQCHTDTQVCPLETPCQKADGTNETGFAGD